MSNERQNKRFARNAEYWKARFGQVEQAQHERGVEAFNKISEQYRQAEKDIQAKIDAWYRRFAKNNGITLAEARQMLNAKELAEFQWDVNDYIKHGRENAVSGEWVKELENASARVHISRLEALKIQCQPGVDVLFGRQADVFDAAMRDIYREGYYHNAFTLQKGFGVGWDLASLDEKRIDRVINTPWAVDGLNFSERLWGNKEKLIGEIDRTLTQNIIRGEDPQKAINDISERLNVSKSQAGRLVMTEEAYFGSAAQQECFKELDVEEYEIVATLDNVTSEICQEMDGKVFKMSEWEVGVTAPPFHPWCRTTTVPAFDDDFDDPGERAARDADGKTYYVPDDMKYPEWKNSFVDGGSKDGLEPFKPGESIKLQSGSESGQIYNNSAPQTPSVENANELATEAIIEQYKHRVDDLGVGFAPYDKNNKSFSETLAANFTGMYLRLAEATAKQFKKLSSEYETMCTKITVTKFDPKMGTVPGRTSTAMNVQQSTIMINRAIVGNEERFMQRMRKAVTERRQFPRMPETEYENYLVTHEFAHSLMDFKSPLKNYVGAETKHIQAARKEIEEIRKEYIERIRDLTARQKEAELKAITGFDEAAWKEAAELSKELEEIRISKYADTSIDEFFAEAFADAKIGSAPSEYSKRVLAVVDKHFGKSVTYESDVFGGVRRTIKNIRGKTSEKPAPEIVKMSEGSFDGKNTVNTGKVIDNFGGGGIIKADKTISGHEPTPKRSEPNAVIDHLGKNGKTETRSFYDENGVKKKDITTHDHNNPKQHGFGAHGEHAHDYLWNEDLTELKERTSRDLTPEEREENSDIL